MIVYYYLARALKNPADDRTPDMGFFFASTQGYDLFESFVSDIIYNTRLLKGCQYMTDTYVVVTLASEMIRLPDPNKDHSPSNH